MSAAAGQAAEAAAHLRTRGFDGPFDAALVLGSGLASVADGIADPNGIPYADIPRFPRVGVAGHGGRLVAGRLGGARVLVFVGRAHPYEHGDSGIMRVPIATLAALGAPPLVLTNASGGVRPDLGPGRIVLVTDHIGHGVPNPLVGETGDARFVPMGECYDPALRARLARAAHAAGVPLAEGVYMWFSGPSFETAAEIRMARTLGADLVGMSTVPEVILARFHGIRVAALSVVTNHATGLGSHGHAHADTQREAAAAADRLGRLLTRFLEEFPDAGP